MATNSKEFYRELTVGDQKLTIGAYRGSGIFILDSFLQKYKKDPEGFLVYFARFGKIYSVPSSFKDEHVSIGLFIGNSEAEQERLVNIVKHYLSRRDSFIESLENEITRTRSAKKFLQRRGINIDQLNDEEMLSLARSIRKERKIIGKWKNGVTFDDHTISSTHIGFDQFGHGKYKSERSEMGELVYQLKYNKDPSAAQKIVKLLNRIQGVEDMDLIIPIPPTDSTRVFQPVSLIAKALGERRNVAVRLDILLKQAGGAQLKNEDDPAERQRLLRNSMSLSRNHDISGKSILLIDDVYRSGATLSVATELLIDHGGASSVYVLAMTKTRSRQ